MIGTNQLHQLGQRLRLDNIAREQLLAGSGNEVHAERMR